MVGNKQADSSSRITRRKLMQVAAMAGVPLAAVDEVRAETLQTRDRTDNDGGSETDNLVIGLPDDVSDPEQAAKARAPAGSEIVKINETLGHAVVKPPEVSTESVSTMAQDLKQQSDVKYVHRDYVVTLDSSEQFTQESVGSSTDSPNDELFDQQYVPQQINATEAWNVTEGSDNVTIAVVDTGIKYDHEDLEANMVDQEPPGKNFHTTVDDIEEALREQDAIDPPYDPEERYGREWTEDDPYPRLFDGLKALVPVLIAEWHGTGVAGVAAGRTNNGIGTAGISNCSLLSVRVTDENVSSDDVDPGGSYTSTIAEAIEYSVDQGADVINLSLGVYVEDESEFPVGAIEEALEYATNNGVVCIAAAGNDGERRERYSPAGHDDCLAVSAVNANEELTSYSNTGSHIDVTAPGGEKNGEANLTPEPVEGGVLEADGIADEYSELPGTSFAAPVVSGVAGLILSVDNSLSPGEVENVLEQTATDLGLGDLEQGAGQVDAAAAVNYVADFEGRTEDTATIYETAATLKANVVGLNPDEDAVVQFHYREQGQESYESTDLVTISSNGAVQTEVTGLADDTTYEYRVRVGIEGGGFGDISTGDWNTFSTEFDVETTTQSDVTASSATLEGEITGLQDGSGAWAGFEYTYTSFDDADFVEVDVSSPGVVSKTVSGLESNTLYAYRFMALTSQGSIEGDWQFFSTDE